MAEKELEVKVKTVSRLHFGFTDLCGDLGGKYGSIGVALENPSTILTVKKNKGLLIERGNEEKILCFLEKFRQQYQIEPNVKINVEKCIPEHTGLGSGTQLALAISKALATIYSVDADIRTLSNVMGRGKRSGIGIAGFETGGFIIDSGRRNSGNNEIGHPPAVIFRRDFPDNWRFVMVIPEAKTGLSGDRENEALQRLMSSKKLSEKVCRLTLVKLIPCLIEGDIEGFGAALTEIDRKNGEYFEEAQGGVYGEEAAQEMIEYMLQCGAYGAGQSSWGPALYGLVEEKESEAVANNMKDFLTRNKKEGSVFVAQCSNRGARTYINNCA